MKSNFLNVLIVIIAFSIITFTNTSFSADYIGSAQCQSCHKKQYDAWQGSHHDMAMKHADIDSVQGDFNNASITFNGKDNKFFKRAQQFWVNIEGPDGQFHDYQIKYTFGFTPLQQYMVEFNDGRVQLIPFAWDARSINEGGQRWFHLYPEFTENHQEFYWTNSGQNWNYMCADCHSTKVEKNFDVKTNSYNTTFSEINVGCEACHGPASDHMLWAKNPTNELKHLGFDRDLTKTVRNWVKKPNLHTLKPDEITKNLQSKQNLVCAQCHSRRTQISNKDHISSNEFGERYLLNLIDSEHYYPDGQVYNEDFVYGSFLQSKMHENGVVCSNCHDAHSAKLTLPKEAVCLQCHQSEIYANKKHHQHDDNSSGAQCINCHMPQTTYMSIDARRDHGWHVPRPDLAKQLGTPDTCLSCHQDKDSIWSEQHVNKWFPNSLVRKEKDFAPIFYAGGQGYQDAAAELSKIAQSKGYANIIRASALSRMALYTDTNSLIALARAVKETDSNIRLGAIAGAANIRGAERWRILSPLVSDQVLTVRAEAAFALVSLWPNLSAAQQQQLTPALNEYIAMQDFNNDRGFAHTNRAIVASYQGQFEQAISQYQKSMVIEPIFAPAYINLAELYRQLQQNDQALKILHDGLKAVPDSADIAYSLGLAYIRNKQKTAAVEFLAKATLFNSSNAHYFYVYGLSLEEIDSEKAYKALHQAYDLSRNPQHLFALCDMQVRKKSTQAQYCIEQLSLVAPENAVAPLKLQLKAMPKN